MLKTSLHRTRPDNEYLTPNAVFRCSDSRLVFGVPKRQDSDQHNECVSNASTTCTYQTSNTLANNGYIINIAGSCNY